MWGEWSWSWSEAVQLPREFWRALFVFSILLTCSFAIAQAPQGFTYQGVATDNNGFELQNQSISIQASILSSSATGTTVWQETHTTSTDTFGLFNVVIGE